MKFGISVSTFPTKFGPIVFSGSDIGHNLETIKKLGYDGVDLFIHQLSEGELKDLQEILSSLELEVSLVAAIFLAEQGVNLSHPNPNNRVEAVAKFKRQIETAGFLNTNMPIGFIRGNKSADESNQSYEKRLADSLRELADYAAKYSVELLLEPINRYEVNTILRVEEAVAFLEKHGLAAIKILPDTFHMNIEEASIEKAFGLAGEKIGHIHITDSNRLAPGQGHLNYDSILGSIKKTGYNGYLTIEAFPVPSAYECAKQGIGYLKQKI